MDSADGLTDTPKNRKRHGQLVAGSTCTGLPGGTSIGADYRAEGGKGIRELLCCLGAVFLPLTIFARALALFLSSGCSPAEDVTIRTVGRSLQCMAFSIMAGSLAPTSVARFTGSHALARTMPKR